METNDQTTKKPKAAKPSGAAKKKRAPAVYYLVRHGDNSLSPVKELTSARGLGAAISGMTEPGKYSLVRVLKSVELRQGLLVVGATFGGAE